MNKDVQYNEEGMKVSAMRRVLKQSANALKDPKFIHKCMDEFMKTKIAMFPRLLAEVRKVNLLKKKQFVDMGNSGGWSEKKDFKWDYEIPTELYTFMINMVARDFWSEENEKQWRMFMDGIMKNEDPTFLLYRAKMHFDGNEETKKLIVTN